MSYSDSFSPELEQEWEWTEKYPTQPELLSYIDHVADRFDQIPGLDRYGGRVHHTARWGTDEVSFEGLRTGARGAAQLGRRDTDRACHQVSA